MQGLERRRALQEISADLWKMEKDVRYMTKNILKLTLEIIYLLTGEDYVPSKNSRNPVTTMIPTGLMYRQSNDEKIRDLTNKILELLTGEVPIRCHDVSIYFSMEEWEYIEGHKDQYKDVMTVDHQPLTSPDVLQTTDIGPGSSRPHSSLDSMHDHSKSLNNEAANLPSNEPIIIENIVETPPLCEEVIYTKDPQYLSVLVRKEPAGLVSASDILTHYTPQDSLTCIRKDLGSWNREDIFSAISPSAPTSTLKEESFSRDEDHPLKHQLPDTRQEKPASYEQNISPRSSNVDVVHHLSSDGDYITYYLQNKPDERLFFCSECGKSFNRNSHLVSHQRSHTGEKPYSCPECGKCFLRSSHLVRHKRIHTGEKPHSCSECGKRFITTSDLLIHRRTHTGERPYHCSECGKSFVCNSVLIKHRRTHTGEKRHCCPDCGKCFSTNAYLVVHQRIHTGEKPFSCSECGKSFTCNSVLTKHQKIHAERKKEAELERRKESQTRQKLYCCSHCGGVFTNNTQFLNHQKIHFREECSEPPIDRRQPGHQGKKTHICWDCGKCFTNERNLVLHQRRHGGEKT